MPQDTTSAKRPRLAAVITAYKRLLHGQHVVDRFLDGYGWAGTYHHPAMDVVSLYVDQRGEGDLTQERLDRHPTMKLYPTIAETLTLGTSKLAVDGVVVVGEHGTYRLHRNGDHEASAFRVLRADHEGLSTTAGDRFPTSTTKSSRTRGTGRRRWWTPLTSWAFLCRGGRAWR